MFVFSNMSLMAVLLHYFSLKLYLKVWLLTVCVCVIQCWGWTVRDICDFVVADAAVCERDPARRQSCCDGHAAASNVDGSDFSEYNPPVLVQDV